MEHLLLVICVAGIMYVSMCSGNGATIEDIKKFYKFHEDHHAIRIRSYFQDRETFSKKKLCTDLEETSKVRVSKDEKYEAVNGWIVASMRSSVTIPGSDKVVNTYGVLSCKMQLKEDTFTYIYYVLTGFKFCEFLEVINTDPNFQPADKNIPDCLLLVTEVQLATEIETQSPKKKKLKAESCQ